MNRSTDPSPRIQSLAGWLILLMVALTISAALITPIPYWPAGIVAWLSGALLISRLPRLQQMTVALLIGLGSLSLISALLLKADPDWLHLLDANTGLLTMLAAVSFLRLVAMQDRPGGALPLRGMSGYTQTMAVVALFGAFINVSAPILIADRLSRSAPLSAFAAQSITRVFTGGPAWSPFFAGMAVVLTYIEEARLLFLMMLGIPFAVVGFSLVLLEARYRYQREVADFKGYPVSLSSLWIPALLTLTVISCHFLLPKLPVLVIIALAALLVSVLGLSLYQGILPALSILNDHVSRSLPGMAGELLLFLAAGFLAVGLQAVVAGAELQLPLLAVYDGQAAALLLAMMVLISALGIHPVISIAVATPLLAPINPDPQLLALTYVLVWSIGTSASPLSGINLIIQGRYGLSSLGLARRNWPFAAMMILVGSLFLWLAALVRGI